MLQYIFLWLNVWGGRGMSWQNGKKLKGVINSSANYSTVCQREKYGSNKKGSVRNAIMEDMKLRTDKVVSQQ